jgi:hypothetical protein
MNPWQFTMNILSSLNVAAKLQDVKQLTKLVQKLHDAISHFMYGIMHNDLCNILQLHQQGFNVVNKFITKENKASDEAKYQIIYVYQSLIRLPISSSIHLHFKNQSIQLPTHPSTSPASYSFTP